MRMYKGVMNALINTFVGFAVLAIVAAVALLIGSNIQTQTNTIVNSNASSYAGYASLGVNQTVYSTYQLSTWLPIVVVVIVGAVLIGLVMGAFKSGSGSGL